MLSEIGSNFWITPEDLHRQEKAVTPKMFGIEGSDYVWLSTGRSAISLAIETIQQRDPAVRKTALIPAFTCHTVIEPFLKLGYTVSTIPVDADLRIRGEALLDAAAETGAGIVLVHSYFGFDTLQDCRSAIRQLQSGGIKVIEDRTQCLYSDVPGVGADYTVGSIRKWHGVPDGGFAVCAQGSFEEKPVTPDHALEKAKVEASVQKYEYLFYGKGDKTAFLQRYRQAEELLDGQREKYAIAGLSLKMQAALDTAQLKAKRRENYTVLAEGIGGREDMQLVFPRLPEGAAPLYCPVLVKDRKRVQQYLASCSVYAPIIWPANGYITAVNEAAELLYRDLLCIPVDQRYGRDDMERLINVLNHQKGEEAT